METTLKWRLKTNVLFSQVGSTSYSVFLKSGLSGVKEKYDTVVCLIIAPYDYSAHFPGVVHWGPGFHLFFARMTIIFFLQNNPLGPGWTFAWIFAKQMGTIFVLILSQDDCSALKFGLMFARMIIRSSPLLNILQYVLLRQLLLIFSFLRLLIGHCWFSKNLRGFCHSTHGYATSQSRLL